MSQIINEDVLDTELDKYFQLCALGTTTEMFSPLLDQHWHKLLEDRKSYIERTTRVCGQVIPHEPFCGYGTIGFVETYEKCFGQLSDVWFRDEFGVLDEEMYKTYRNTGRVIASWECSATHNCLALPEDQNPAPKESDKKSGGKDKGKGK